MNNGTLGINNPASNGSNCLWIVVIIVVLFALCYWFVFPKINSSEQFGLFNINPPQAEEAEKEEESVEEEKSAQPVLGPSCEGIEIEGASEGMDSVPSNYDLDDGANGAYDITNNMCSKLCCGVQYPPPFPLEKDPLVCNNKDSFVPSNYYCNNASQNAGCLCLDKKQADFLNNRGGNGRDFL